MGRRARPPVGGAVGVARARIGRRHRRRARGDESLLGDRQGHGADDDRRARARRLRDAGPASRQERARRQPRPRHERRHRRRGRVRGRSLRAGSALPLVPADVGRRAAAARSRAPTTPSAARRCCCRSCRATRVTSTRCAPSSRRSSDREADGTSSFFEIGRQWGKSIICGLARFDGWPVALFAEDPYIYGGAWTASSSQKVTRAHRPRDARSTCRSCTSSTARASSSGCRPSRKARSATARARSPRSGESPSPYCSVVIRKAFGVAGAANSRPGSFHYRCAWPSGDWGSLPDRGRHRGGVQGRARRGRRTETRISLRSELGSIEVRSPFRSAEAFDIEDIVDPRDTRLDRLPVGRPGRARPPAGSRLGCATDPERQRSERRTRRGRRRTSTSPSNVARTRASHSSSGTSKSPGTRCESATWRTPGLGRDRADLLGRRVRAREVVPDCSPFGSAHDALGETVDVEDLVHEQVGVACEPSDVRALTGVAREDDRAVRRVEAVAERREHRRVLHEDRAHLHTVLVLGVDDDRLHVRSRRLPRSCSRRRRRDRCRARSRRGARRSRARAPTA